MTPRPRNVAATLLSFLALPWLLRTAAAADGRAAAAAENEDDSCLLAVPQQQPGQPGTAAASDESTDVREQTTVIQESSSGDGVQDALHGLMESDPLDWNFTLLRAAIPSISTAIAGLDEERKSQVKTLLDLISGLRDGATDEGSEGLSALER